MLDQNAVHPKLLFIAFSMMLCFFASLSPASAAPNAGDNSTTAHYDRGSVKYFGRIDYSSPGKWIETTKDQSYRNEYVETGRDPSSVFLFDASRNLRLQLDFARRMIAISINGEPYSDYEEMSASASLTKGTRPFPPAETMSLHPMINECGFRPGDSSPDMGCANSANTDSQNLSNSGNTKAADAQSNDTARIVSAVSGKCLALDLDGFGDNFHMPMEDYMTMAIILAECNGGIEQSFTTKDQGGGYASIVWADPSFFDVCLDHRVISTFARGEDVTLTGIHQEMCDNSNGQFFKEHDLGDGYHLIITYSGDCLNVRNDSAEVNYLPCNGSIEQKFSYDIIPALNASPQPL